MWLLLASSHDRAALWAAGRLKGRGIDPLVVLTPELLHYSFSWQHRVRPDGATSVAFTLADGRRIDGRRIQGVLNRMAVLPPHLLGHFTDVDRAYALQEWTALHISWLSSLPVPVLNLPAVQGLCGAWRHLSEWVWLASQAGLETEPYIEAVPDVSGRPPPRAASSPANVPHRTVFVVDGQPVGDVPENVAVACGRLGTLARTRLIGVDLDARTLKFAGASPLPDFRIGGEAIVEALALALGGGP